MFNWKPALLKQKLIGKAAETMVLKMGSPPVIAPVNKKLSEARVALITTAGVLLKNQPLFNTKDGDPSYRSIPDETPLSQLMINHGHYDQSDAEQDINCVFPIERLHELVKDGVIGSAASRAPRSCHVPFPLGRSFGRAGQAVLQRKILQDLLQFAITGAPESIEELPYKWDK